MDGTALPIGHGQLTTPHAAIAGIVFTVLMGIAYVLAQLAVPTDATEREWLVERAELVQFALGLVPFAGIAFLWFIGVVRDRIGALEDRFFSTVLLGSGLLYLRDDLRLRRTSWRHPHGLRSRSHAGGREWPVRLRPFRGLSHVERLRPAHGGGIHDLRGHHLAARTHLLRQWAVLVTYGLALVQLLGVSYSLWVTLILPAWVLMISLVFLITGPRQHPS